LPDLVAEKTAREYTCAYGNLVTGATADLRTNQATDGRAGQSTQNFTTAGLLLIAFRPDRAGNYHHGQHRDCAY
jgi:hypothetical protein